MEKINPFDEGVTYAEFLAKLGKQKIEDYLKDICDQEQITWLKVELEHFENNNKK